MTLAKLIERQIEEVAALAELLETERAAVAHRDAGALESIAASKLTRLAEIERIERETRDWLAAAEFTANTDGMARAVAQSPDPSLQPQWRKLQSMLASLRAHNERNGLAIRRSLTTVEDELTVLRDGPGGAPIYNADGQHARDGGSRPLTSA